MRGKIIVVTHKDYQMPKDLVYLPVCVGVGRESLRGKYQADDEGANISDKNIAYCELTALYWAWKNLNEEYIGMAHYRRYFGNKNTSSLNDVLSSDDIARLILTYDLIVSKPKHYFQTVANHYINCIKSRKENNAIQLRLLRESINELHPEYLDNYDMVMYGHSAHMLNMFIMKKDDLDAYCEWLFSILFLLEKKIEDNNVYYDRIMGSFSEFLLDVWIKKNNKRVYETKIVETEKNFFKKIKWVINRRLLE